MKIVVLFAAVLAVAAAQRYNPAPRPSKLAARPNNPSPARVSSSDQAANIVRYESDINPDGSYGYAMLLGLPRYCSASGMFADARMDDFHTIMRRRIASLMRRVRGSANSILNVIGHKPECAIQRHWVYVHAHAPSASEGRLSFETDNGIAVQEQGTPRDFGGNPPLIPIVAQGSYSYTAPGGEPISISYIADENGYQPQGDAIPTSPPLPPLIARALEYLSRT